MWHDSFTWLIHSAYRTRRLLQNIYDMTHPYVWDYPCICVQRLIHTCWYAWLIRVDMLDGIYTAYPTRCLMQYMYDMTDSCVTWLNHTRDGHIWSRNGDRTWLVHMCLFVWQEMMHRALRTRCLLHYMYDMNHLPLWHDSIKHMTTIFDHATATRHGKFKCGHMCDTTRSQRWLDETLAALHVWHDWFIRAIWLNHTRDVIIWPDTTHAYVLISLTWLIHICLTWLIHLCLTWLIHIVYQTRCLPQDV